MLRSCTLAVLAVLAALLLVSSPVVRADEWDGADEAWPTMDDLVAASDESLIDSAQAEFQKASSATAAAGPGMVGFKRQLGAQILVQTAAELESVSASLTESVALAGVSVWQANSGRVVDVRVSASKGLVFFSQAARGVTYRPSDFSSPAKVLHLQGDLDAVNEALAQLSYTLVGAKGLPSAGQDVVSVTAGDGVAATRNEASAQVEIALPAPAFNKLTLLLDQDTEEIAAGETASLSHRIKMIGGSKAQPLQLVAKATDGTVSLEGSEFEARVRTMGNHAQIQKALDALVFKPTGPNAALTVSVMQSADEAEDKDNTVTAHWTVQA